MKVQVLQENFQRGLAIVSRAVPSQTSLPIAANVLVGTDGGRLKLSATDLDISISAWIGARVDSEGVTTIPARLLNDFVAQLPAETTDIELPDGERQVRIACARHEATINIMNADDFPAIESLTEGISIDSNAAELKHAIDRVEFAAANDDTRPVLTGVSFKTDGETLTLAAADGFRLAVADVALANAPTEALDIIVPARALRELSRLMGDSDDAFVIRVNNEKTKILFGRPDFEIVAQLVQGTFPNYQQLIPSEWSTRTIIDADQFSRSARIAAVLARDGSGIVRVQITPEGDDSSGKLVLSARADEIGDNQNELEAQVEGEAAQIAFNSRYLKDVLDALSGDIALETTSPSSQGVFRSVNDDSYLHVVMPMFVQW
jgi:DNA polymerase-3 subunit beta